MSLSGVPQDGGTAGRAGGAGGVVTPGIVQRREANGQAAVQASPAAHGSRGGWGEGDGDGDGDGEGEGDGEGDGGIGATGSGPSPEGSATPSLPPPLVGISNGFGGATGLGSTFTNTTGVPRHGPPAQCPCLQ